MKIGILASQGAFNEHIYVLHQLKVEAVPVRLPRELEDLDGLIIPGGESTSINKLIMDYDLRNQILDLAGNELSIFGTCAGMVLLASETLDSGLEPLRIMDISVRRNAFGRQQESFETELSIPVLGDAPFPGIFIRAPVIERAGSGVEILAELKDGTSVAARQGKLLVSAFHPELTEDFRFHQYFLDIVKGD
ncbi:pyridoxal 5'-phosphate synthase glutaminase subunit PdxT [Chloroflexota bacterium]